MQFWVEMEAGAKIILELVEIDGKPYKKLILVRFLKLAGATVVVILTQYTT